MLADVGGTRGVAIGTFENELALAPKTGFCFSQRALKCGSTLTIPKGRGVRDERNCGKLLSPNHALVESVAW